MTGPSGSDRPQPDLGRGRRFLFTSIMIGLIAVLIAVPSEWMLRFWERSRAVPRLGLVRVNPFGTGSVRLIPDLRWQGRVGDRIVRIRINHQGMHWYPVDPARPPDRSRIAFLGDSFTFGCWAGSFEKSFVGVVNAGITPHGWEALNFGVPGYGLDDMELILHEEVSSYDPRVVVVMFFNGNDFRDTWLGLDKYEVVGGTERWNHAVLAARLPAELIPPQRSETIDPLSGSASWRGAGGFLKRHFALARAGASLKSSLRAWLARTAHGTGGDPATTVDSLSVRTDIFTSFAYWSQTPYPPLAARARDVSLATLDRIDRFCRAKGIRLCIAAIPYREQVYTRAPVTSRYDAGLPQRFVEDFARSRDIPYCDLLPALRDSVRAGGREIYVRGDTHWNERGHAMVGGILTGWLEREVLPR